MSSGSNESVRGFKRPSHFRVVLDETEVVEVKERDFDGAEYVGVETRNRVVRYAREHYDWFVSGGDDTLFVRDKRLPLAEEGGSYVAAYKDWSSVEDCDDPESE